MRKLIDSDKPFKFYPKTTMNYSMRSAIVRWLLFFLWGFLGRCYAEDPKLCELPSGTAAVTRPALSGNVQYVMSTNFRVHYTLSGRDVSSLAFAQNISSAAEYARTVYSNLGWLSPPPDGGTGGLNPDNLYDIYIIDMDSLRGPANKNSASCRPEGPYTDPYPNGATSWIEIDRDFDDFPWVPGIIPADTIYRAITAHEVHHACQNRYRKFPNRRTVGDVPPYLYDSLWFYENTSHFIEDVVYDDINVLSRVHLKYSPGDIVNPLFIFRQSIDFKEFLITGALWPTFLHEYYGPDCVRRVWEKIGSIPGNHFSSKIDAALVQYYNSTFKEALREYAIWRFFTGNPNSGGRADAYHFSEAGSWPTSVILRTHTTYGGIAGSGDQDEYFPMSPGGTNFVVFSGTPTALQFNLNAQETYDWRVTIVGHRTNAPSYEATLGLDSFAINVSKVLKAGTDYLVLIPVNVDTFVTINPTYSYSVSEISSSQVTNTVSSGWNMVSVPNVVSNFSKSSVYPTAVSSAFKYTPSGYSSQDPLSNGPGYWVKFSSGQNITNTGKPLDIMWAPINSGWNMVGSLYQDISPDKIFPSKGISVTSRYQRYNGTGYDSLVPGNPNYSIKKGEGYWIKAGEAGYLTYNSTSSAAAPLPTTIDPNPPAAPPGPPAAPVLSGTVSNTHPALTWTSVGSNMTYKVYRYECEGSIDCNLPGSLRYEGTGLSYTDLSIIVGNKFDPTTMWYYVTATDNFGQTSAISNKKWFWRDDGYQEKTRHNNADEGKTTVSPNAYALAGNYPNPFNPVTQITYSLPENSYVTLKVYNLLGQVIATLVDGVETAGYKSVTFDAGSYESGVYFYKLTAGSFAQVKKMLLAK